MSEFSYNYYIYTTSFVSPFIILWRQMRHIFIKFREIFRLKFDGDGALGDVFNAFDKFLLFAPAVAGDPVEWLRQIGSFRCHQNASVVDG